MSKRWGKGTFKSKIIVYNFIIICTIAIFVSVCSYVTVTQRTIQIAKSSLQHNVETVANKYQMAYDEMVNIVLNCSGRKSFDLNGLNKLDNIKAKARGLEYAKLLGDYCAITGYGEYITKLIIFDNKGALIQVGTSLNSSDDGRRIQNEKWFLDELNQTMELYRLRLVEPLFCPKNSKMLPIARRLSGTESDKNGWVVIFLSAKFYQDCLEESSEFDEMVVTTSTGETIASMEEADSKDENEKITKELLQCSRNKGIIEKKIHGKRSFISFEKDLRSGILVWGNLPIQNVSMNRFVIIQTVLIMAGASILFGLILSIIFTTQMQKPINYLVEHLEKIAKGDFKQDFSLESDDEIGEIGKVVNNMSGQIENLMKQKVDDEKEKSRLELKMLQAQINPHFLYNTLDSIKWLAVIQKNTGIVKVVGALSNLLKNMSKGFNEKITVRKELEFLEDYITIEKIRYVEMFDVTIKVANPKLYNAKIIKMTLQPLVENAIFNGIEPGGKNGTIQIRIFSDGESLITEIYDDGKGIPEDKLQSILKDKEKVKKDCMSGIGLPNVDRRIKLTYGEEYGLSIKSKVDKYTQITIRIPLEYEQEEHNVSGNDCG